MATYTSRLNLKKPDPSDFYNIGDFNENADKLDAEIVKISDKATKSDAELGTNDTKWMTPQKSKNQYDLLSVDTEGTSLYIAFCGNVNTNMLDAAFGKPDDGTRGVGIALSRYSWFKGDSDETYPHAELKTKLSFVDCLSDDVSLTDMMNTASIYNIIMASNYAKGLLNDGYFDKYIAYSLSLVGYTYTSFDASMASTSEAKKFFEAINKTPSPDTIYDIMINNMSLYDKMKSSLGYTGMVSSPVFLSVLYNDDGLYKKVENDATNYMNAALSSPALVTKSNQKVGTWYNNKCWVVHVDGNSGAGGSSYYSRIKTTRDGQKISTGSSTSRFTFDGFRAMKNLAGESSHNYGEITVKYIPCQ